MSATTTNETKLLRVVVCLFPNVTALDFVGPMELLSFLIPANARFGPYPYAIDVTHASISKDPVRAGSALTMVPDTSYEEATEQFDIILVPGGMEATNPH